MALRAAHGQAKKCGAAVMVEVPPVDELRPIQAEEQARASAAFGGKRNAFQPGSALAKRAGAKGGAARASRAALRAQVSALGLGDLAADPAFKTYVDEAETFRAAYAGQLADMAGGVCGIGPSSMIATSALQLAASRYLFVLAGRETDSQLAAKLFARAGSLGDSSRQNLLAAFHLAELESRSRTNDRRTLPAAGLSDADALARRKAEEEAALADAAE